MSISFISIAQLIAKESRCKSRQVGAVLVRDGKIISAGCNWVPVNSRCFFSEKCLRKMMGFKSGDGLEHCSATHAEIIVLRGVENSHGTSLYVTASPCSDCAKAIVEAGVSKVYYLDTYPSPGSARILEEGNVLLEQLKEE